MVCGWPRSDWIGRFGDQVLIAKSPHRVPMGWVQIDGFPAEKNEKRGDICVVEIAFFSGGNPWFVVGHIRTRCGDLEIRC